MIKTYLVTIMTHEGRVVDTSVIRSKYCRHYLWESLRKRFYNLVVNVI
jgi:hypothetical protein